jgi:hypothetical protein
MTLPTGAGLGVAGLILALAWAIGGDQDAADIPPASANLPRLASSTAGATAGAGAAQRDAVVKIDVEGAERLVLEGGARALSEKRIDLLQLEWNSCSLSMLGEDRTPVAELLRDHGYELVRPIPTMQTLVAQSDMGFGRDMFARPSPDRAFHH